MARRPLDRDGGGPVLHQEAGWNHELKAQVRMGEAAPVDNALGGIVVDGDAFQLRQEGIAVAKTLSGAAGLASGLGGFGHPVLAERVRARPFRGRAVGVALDPRFER